MSLEQRLDDLIAVIGFDVKDLDSRIPYFLGTDPWHKVGTAGEPAFTGGWVNYSAAYFLGFRKAPNGRVAFRGLIKSGTPGQIIFTLPVGYRPVQECTFLGFAAGGPAYISISTAGAVSCTNIGASNAASYIYMDEVEFDTDTVTQAMMGPKGDPGDPGPQGEPGDSVMVPLDPWRVVGAVGQPAFTAGFSSTGATPVAFRKDPTGKVRLRGFVNVPAAGGIAFTLPTGCRPPTDYVRFPVNANVSGGNSTGLVYVGANGTVNVLGITGLTSVDLSVIEFDTDTVTEFAVGPKGDPGAPANYDITTPSVSNWNDAPLGAAYALASATNAPAYDAAVDSGLFMAETWEVVDPQDAVNNTFIVQRATDLMSNATFERRSWFGRSSWKAWTKVVTSKAPIWTSLAGMYFNSWTEYDTARYSKDALGYVQLRGEIRAWTGGSTAADVGILAFPAGFRPVLRTGCPVWSNDGLQLSLYITADGTMRVSRAVGASVVVNLGSVRWPTQ